MKKKRSSKPQVPAKKISAPLRAAVPITPHHAAGMSMFAMALLTLYLAAFLVMTFERNKVYQTGLSVWKSMVESSPNKRRTHENYGQALSTAGRLQEALKEFQQVLALPDDGSVPLRDVYREIGVAQFRLGSYDDAIAAWQKGLVYAPFDAGLLNNLAIAFLKLNRYDDAISYAQAAARSNPVMPEPANTLGEISLARGEYLASAKYFKQYLYLRPEDPKGSWNLALALTRGGNYDEAYQYAMRFASVTADPAERAGAQELMNFITEARQKKIR